MKPRTPRVDPRIAKESYSRLRETIKNMNALDQFVWVASLLLLMPLERDDSRSTMVATDGRTIFYNPALVAKEGDPDVIREELGGLAMGCSLKHHTRRHDRDPAKWQWASWQTRLPLMRDAGLTGKQGGLELSCEEAYKQAPDPPEGDSGSPGEDGAGSGEAWQGVAMQGAAGRGEEPNQTPPQQQQPQPQQAPPPPAISVNFDGHGEIMDSPAVNEQPGIGDSQDDQDENAENQPEDSSGGDGGGESGSDTQPPPPARQSAPSDPVQEEEQRWDEALQHARQAAKRRGTDPGVVQEMIESMHSSLVDWRELLRRYLFSHASSDYTWARPNRRFIDDDLYLPSLRSEAIGDIVFCVDTSGSMSPEELSAAWSEIRSCAEELQPDEVHVIQCDAAVSRHDRYHPSDLPEQLQVAGRGGTSFIPALNYVTETVHTMPVVIYITDMMGLFPDEAPQYDVMWLSTMADPAEPPFGELVVLE